MKIGVMEDPMDGNEDDNLDQGWKLKERKTKQKLASKGGWSVFEVQSKEKCEQRRKEESGACMQLHVRDGMVSFGNLT